MSFLSSPISGACMVYDPQPYEVRRWINRRLGKLNMVWRQPGFGPFAAIYQLDASKPLPKDFFLLGEKVWAESFEYLDHLIKRGRVSKKWLD